MMRKYIEDNIVQLIKGYEKIALSFSGGTDSSCLLFSLLDMKIFPILYIYKLKDYNSPDYEKASFFASKYKLILKVAEIPIDMNILYADVVRIIKDGIHGKVNIQCMHGHYYIAPIVDEPIILNGSGIDGIYGVYKDMAIVKDSRLFFEKRRKHIENKNDDAMVYQSDCYAKHGVKVVYPYRIDNIIQYLCSKNWDEINKPKYKWITIKDYKEWFDSNDRYYRPRGSQQIMAGTRSLHDKLLSSKFNVNNCSRIIQLYKEIERELNNASQI